MSIHSRQFLLVCTVTVYDFNFNVTVDFNFILISPSKPRFISTWKWIRHCATPPPTAPVQLGPGRPWF